MSNALGILGKLPSRGGGIDYVFIANDEDGHIVAKGYNASELFADPDDNVKDYMYNAVVIDPSTIMCSMSDGVTGHPGAIEYQLTSLKWPKPIWFKRSYVKLLYPKEEVRAKLTEFKKCNIWWGNT